MDRPEDAIADLAKSVNTVCHGVPQRGKQMHLHFGEFSKLRWLLSIKQILFFFFFMMSKDIY